MGPRLKRLPARFYRSHTGREPVREWLKGLEADERKLLGEDIKDVEFSWPIGMPLVRSLGREWLKGLEADERKLLGEDIKDVEFSWPIGMPLVRSLGRELWEVRSNLPHGRIARVIFCVEQGGMVLLHGFIKKTRKTPQRDIELALKRKKGGDA